MSNQQIDYKLEQLRNIFMYSDEYHNEFNFRAWVHTVIILLFTVGTWALSNYVFNFGCLATFILVTVTTAITAVCYIAFFVDDKELGTKLFELLFGCSIIFCLIGGVGSLLTSNDSLTKVEKFKPDTIVHSNKECTIVIFGDQTRTSYSAKDYNNPNLMMCKEMRWNDWNRRIQDMYYICE